MTHITALSGLRKGLWGVAISGKKDEARRQAESSKAQTVQSMSRKPVVEKELREHTGCDKIERNDQLSPTKAPIPCQGQRNPGRRHLGLRKLILRLAQSCLANAKAARHDIVDFGAASVIGSLSATSAAGISPAESECCCVSRCYGKEF
jgi:hypothetical protein